MAHYTTMVRSYLETLAGYDTEQDFDQIDEVIRKSRSKVFTKDYELWDDSYKAVIESKILYHYYMREIGAETAGLWKYYMNRTMTEIMPYYSKLYESAAIKYDPLTDVNYTRQGHKEGTEDAIRDSVATGKDTKDYTINKKDTENDVRKGNIETTENNKTSDSGTITDAGTSGSIRNDTRNTTINGDIQTSNEQKDRFSDTPQNGLSQVENDQYLTTYRNVTDSGETNEIRTTGETGRSEETGTAGNVRTLATTTDTQKTVETDTEETGNKQLNSDTKGNEKGTLERKENAKDDIDTTEQWIESIKGKYGAGTYAKMIEEYRKTLLNIDAMVIREFRTCFFGLV